MQNNGLSLNGVCFSYTKENPFLENINLQLKTGRITAVIGANGCGKTTLFKLMTGQLKAYSGSVCLDGKKVSKIKRRDFARRVAAVYQYNEAPEDITVAALVAFGRTPYRTAFSGFTARDKEAVENAMKMTGTYEFRNRMISDLSGGEKQRVWLAAALAQQGDILLLDEITTYLDIRYQLELLELIRKLNKEHRLTVLMIIHDINEATQYSDEVIVMKKGRIIANGETNEVITGEILHETFGVSVEITEINGKKYCIFEKSEADV